MQSRMNADMPDQHIDSGIAEHCYYPVGEAGGTGRRHPLWMFPSCPELHLFQSGSADNGQNDHLRRPMKGRADERAEKSFGTAVERGVGYRQQRRLCGQEHDGSGPHADPCRRPSARQNRAKPHRQRDLPGQS